MQITLAAAALAGCAVGPNFQKPPVTLAPFHAAPPGGIPGKAAAPPLDHWWDGFDDPELTRIVGRTLAQNLDLAAALARVDQARAAAREAGAQLLPTLDATASASWIHDSLESPIGSIGRHLAGFRRDGSLYDLGAAASWEIDLFGGLRRGSEAARAEAEAAEAARLGAAVSITADAADAYFEVRGDQARLAVAQAQVATDEHLRDLVQQRFAEGLGSAREADQADALLAAARGSLQPLRIDLEAQLNRLDVLMGAQPGTYAAELAAAGAIPNAPSVAGLAPDAVLRRRPDVIVAEHRLAASNARIGQAIAEYYPKLSVAGLLGFESASADRLFRAATFRPEAAAGLRWRLFDFGKIDAEVAQAKGANAEALADYRKAVLVAAQDVENAFTALAELKSHEIDSDAQVAALTKARNLSQRAYASGAIPLTDVLDANRQLLAAQDDLEKTRADVDRAAVRTFRALGGGWS
jgi:NodT family efflux transporter outer membrane factor (OMF) lipoprotein